MIKRYSPQVLVDQLRSALSSLLDRTGKENPWLHHCNTGIFNPDTEHPQRFWLPVPKSGREKKTDSEQELRPVLIELQDQEQGQGILQVHADGIVVDDLLGTIGLIQFCFDDTTTHDGQSVVNRFVLKVVREAMGLRHEMLRRAGSSARAYYVELVLVIPGISPHEIAAVGQTLRTIMSRTGYLHAIGVNVLAGTAADRDLDFRHCLHRAFSWLLPRSRNWYIRVAEQRESRFRSQLLTDPKAGIRLASLTELRLSNFRLSGTRVWKPDRQFRLHVIHGFNGTGKSTLVDAVELLLANRVERVERGRIADTIRYDDILRNRDVNTDGNARTPASIQAKFSPGESSTDNSSIRMDVVANGLKSAGARFTKLTRQIELFRGKAETNSGCFRLEQNLADRLTLGTSADRARTILTSFFPDSSHQRDQMEQLNRDLAALVQQLRTVWPESESVKWLQPVMKGGNSRMVLEELQSRINTFASVSVKLSELLGLYCDDKEAFEKGLSDLLGSEWLAETEKLLTETSATEARHSHQTLARIGRMITKATEGIAETAENLREMQAKLTQIFQWRAERKTSTGSTEDYYDRVSDWLKKHVETDLLRRFDQLHRTVGDKEQLSTDFESDISGIRKAFSTNSPAERLSAYESQRADMWSQVIGFRSAEEESQTVHPRPDVSHSELVAMDRWIKSDPSFSSVVRTAFQLNEPQSGVFEKHSSYAVGAGDNKQGEPLMQKVASLSKAAEIVTGLSINRVSDLHSTLAVLRKLHDVCVRRQSLDEGAVKELELHLKSDGSLTLALNELLALFTPARWAYDDITANAQLQGTEPGVELSAGNHAVSQVLNTAELNALALSLFLLCAPQIPNPLNLLILDDPLQNMDELSVTAVARGIDRLMRLWRSETATSESKSGSKSTKLAPLSELRLLLMLHGEDDVHRFRTECSCFIYSLPWLSPEAAAGNTSQFELVQDISGARSMAPSLSRPCLRIMVTPE